MVQNRISPKNMKKLILPLVFFILSGCYYDSEEALYGKPGACNTSDIKFSTAVQPILNTYCVTCHYNNAPTSVGSGIRLDDYDNVKIYVVNGQLKSSIEHTAGTYMPYMAGKLSECNILIINAWITDSAKKN